MNNIKLQKEILFGKKVGKVDNVKDSVEKKKYSLSHHTVVNLLH